MKHFKVRDVEKGVKCGFSLKKLGNELNKNYQLAIALSNIIESIHTDGGITEENVNNEMNQLDDSLFITSKEKKCIVENFKTRINAFKEFLYDYTVLEGFEKVIRVTYIIEKVIEDDSKNDILEDCFLNKNIKYTYDKIEILTKEEVDDINEKFKDLNTAGIESDKKIEIYLSVNCAMVLKDNDDNLLAVNINYSKPKIKAKGRTESTNPAINAELFFMKYVAQKIYRESIVNSGVIYLKNENISEDKNFFNKKKYLILAPEEIEENYLKIVMNVLKAYLRLRDGVRCNKGDCDNNCKFKIMCDFNGNEDVIKSTKAAVLRKGNPELKLTPEQEKFVYGTEYGIYRINSVAGAGKTTVLANRTLYLIENGYLPSDILLITFTNEGCKEMKEKLEFWAKARKLDVDVDKFNVFTFNSFGSEVIKRNYKELGFLKAPVLADSIVQLDIIKEVLDEMDEIKGLHYEYPLLKMFKARGALHQALDYVLVCKAENLIWPEQIAEKFDVEISVGIELLELVNRYNTILYDRGYIDYPDQINKLYIVFCDENLRRNYTFKHIVVDEYQDSNASQLSIIKIMIQNTKFLSLCVLGDDLQAIYGFNNVDATSLLNFHKEFKDVQNINLEDNFRSTKEICGLANKLSDNFKKKINKELKAHKSGEAIERLDNDNQKIADKIKSYIDSVPLNEICVIARTRAELVEIKDCLSAKGIPSKLGVSELLVEKPKTIIVANLAKFLINPKYELYLAGFLRYYRPEEFDKAIETNKFEEFLREEKEKIINEMKSWRFYDRHLKRFFMYLIGTIDNGDGTIEKIRKLINQQKLNTLEEIEDYLSKLIMFNSDITVENLDDGEAVVLTTAHSSKGKEFEVVFILLDKFKYECSKDSSGMIITTPELEETRRLLYVAITRAKTKLYIASGKWNAALKGKNDCFERELLNTKLLVSST